MKDKLEAPADSSLGDTAHALAKGAIGTVPVIGSLLAEGFALALSPPFQKRLCNFLEQVAERMNSCELRVEDAVSKEEFLTAIRITADISQRTHDETKRKMLVNAALNVGKSEDKAEDDTHQLFLALLRDLTPVHLKFLLLINDPNEYSKRAGINRTFTDNILTENNMTGVIPQLVGGSAFTNGMVRGLTDEGLINDDAPRAKDGTVIDGGFKMSAFGKKFLDFVLR